MDFTCAILVGKIGHQAILRGRKHERIYTMVLNRRFLHRFLAACWPDYGCTLCAAKRGFRLVTPPLLPACPLKRIPMNLLRLARSYLVTSLRQLHASLRVFLQHQKISLQVRRQQSGIKVILGAAQTHFPGWISTNYPTVDITRHDSMSRHFKTGAVSAFLAEHVWEHLTPEQADAACRNCYDALAPGGYLRMAVPDGLHPDPAYIEQVRPGGLGPGSDDHKVLYNYKTLSSMLESAGFKIKLLEYFDGDGKFHYSEWSPDDGMIIRSSRFDKRNAVRPNAYASLIVDALKSAR